MIRYSHGQIIILYDEINQREFEYFFLILFIELKVITFSLRVCIQI